MLRVGYRIRLSSGKGPDREGVVTALVGSMLRVRWLSQEETLVMPGPGTITVLASSGDDAPSPAPPGQPAPEKAVSKKGPPKKATGKGPPKKATGKATSKKAAAKAAPKTEARKVAPTKKKAATAKTPSTKKTSPTRTTPRKAVGKSGSEARTGSRRQGR